MTVENNIALEDVSKTYGSLTALHPLALHIAAGEWAAVTGPSGSGKTTLINLIGCLDRPSQGRVCIGGADVNRLSRRELVRFRSRRIGLVFQQFHLVPYLTALENVMLAQYFHSLTDKGEAREALQRVGLGDRSEHLPAQLSGGERQRVCIARALINDPGIVLADEPTGNLDESNAAQVMELLAAAHRAGRTIVMVTHDPVIAARATRQICLRHGRLEEASSAALADCAQRAKLSAGPAACSPQLTTCAAG